MRRLLALGLLCMVPLLGIADTVALQQICLDEDKRFCAYEANPGAEQSIVLVHGLNGGALGDWQQQLDVLARSYHVLAIKLPGFGSEGEDADFYSPSSFSEVIHRFTRRYTRGPYVLIGHSMGGAIALRHALHYPDQVQRLVLADVAGVLHRISYSREIIGHWARGGTGEHSGFSGFLEKMAMKFIATGERVPGTDQSVNDVLLRHTNDPKMLASMQLVRQDYSGQLLGLWVPTLIIWGAEDPIAPVRTGYALNARLPNARMHVIPGARHIPMRENAAAFNRILLDFLQADGVLPDQGKTYRLPAQVNDSARVAVCHDRDGLVYEGDYARIELRGCERVVIRNARINFLKVHNSRISVLHSRIGGEKRALAMEAVGADIKLTASLLQGETAIDVSGSRLDLAGVSLIANRYGVKAASGSDLVFSISELRIGGDVQYLHGFYELDYDHALPPTRQQ